MKLEELKNKINEMYDKYGDIEVIFEFKTGGNYFYSFYNEKNEPVSVIDDKYYLDETFDTLLIEEILDIQETYDGEDVTLSNVTGICLSNYIQEGDYDGLMD